MGEQNWKEPSRRSVGSLPSPIGAQAAAQDGLARDGLGQDGFGHGGFGEDGLVPHLNGAAWAVAGDRRVLGGRWQQAMRAERALGLILWICLIAVIVLVSF